MLPPSLSLVKLQEATASHGTAWKMILGARSTRTAVIFGQRLLRFSLDYLHKMQLWIKQISRM